MRTSSSGRAGTMHNGKQYKNSGLSINSEGLCCFFFLTHLSLSNTIPPTISFIGGVGRAKYYELKYPDNVVQEIQSPEFWFFMVPDEWHQTGSFLHYSEEHLKWKNECSTFYG